MLSLEELQDRFTADANQAVRFRLVRSQEDFEGGDSEEQFKHHPGSENRTLPGQYDDERKSSDIEMSKSGVISKLFDGNKNYARVFNPDIGELGVNTIWSTNIKLTIISERKTHNSPFP